MEEIEIRAFHAPWITSLFRLFLFSACLIWFLRISDYGIFMINVNVAFLGSAILISKGSRLKILLYDH